MLYWPCMTAAMCRAKCLRKSDPLTQQCGACITCMQCEPECCSYPTRWARVLPSLRMFQDQCAANDQQSVAAHCRLRVDVLKDCLFVRQRAHAMPSSDCCQQRARQHMKSAECKPHHTGRSVYSCIALHRLCPQRHSSGIAGLYSTPQLLHRVDESVAAARTAVKKLQNFPSRSLSCMHACSRVLHVLLFSVSNVLRDLLQNCCLHPRSHSRGGSVTFQIGFGMSPGHAWVKTRGHVQLSSHASIVQTEWNRTAVTSNRPSQPTFTCTVNILVFILQFVREAAKIWMSWESAWYPQTLGSQRSPYI